MDRRTILKSLAATPFAFAGSPVFAAPYAEAAWRKSIVIDGLGSISDVGGIEGQLLFSAKGRAELLQSGITAFHVTAGSVGNGSDAFEASVGGIASTR